MPHISRSQLLKMPPLVAKEPPEPRSKAPLTSERVQPDLMDVFDLPLPSEERIEDKPDVQNSAVQQKSSTRKTTGMPVISMKSWHVDPAALGIG